MSFPSKIKLLLDPTIPGDITACIWVPDGNNSHFNEQMLFCTLAEDLGAARWGELLVVKCSRLTLFLYLQDNGFCFPEEIEAILNQFISETEHVEDLLSTIISRKLQGATLVSYHYEQNFLVTKEVKYNIDTKLKALNDCPSLLVLEQK